MFRSIRAQVSHFYGQKWGWSRLGCQSHQKKCSRGFWSSWPLLSVGAAFFCPWTLQKSLRMCKDPGKGRPKGIHDARQGTNSHIPLETLDTLIKMGCMHSINLFLPILIGRRTHRNSVDSFNTGRSKSCLARFPIVWYRQIGTVQWQEPCFESQEFRCSRFSIGFPFPTYMNITRLPMANGLITISRKKQFRITNGLRLNVFWSSKPPGPTIAGQWVLWC